MLKITFFTINLLCTIYFGFAATISGYVKTNDGLPISEASVYIEGYSKIFYSDSTGFFRTDDLKSGNYTIHIEKFGYTTITKSIELFYNSDLSTGIHTLYFGDYNGDGVVTLSEVAFISSFYHDSTQNFNRFLDFNNNSIIDSVEIVSAMESINKKSDPFHEFLVSKPDYVTFIPQTETNRFLTNQHYLTQQLKSKRIFSIWTAGYMEASDNQSVLCHWSDDNGLTWTKFSVIDGPETDGKISSWAFFIYIENLNRIYVFYNKDTGSRIYHQGELLMKYSDDEGGSWSHSYKYSIEKGQYSAKGDTVMYWWAYQNPIKIENKYLVGFTDIFPHEPDIFYATEIRFLQFENITTETNPENLIITTWPKNGKVGLRGSYYGGTARSTLQEPSLIQLSDGRLFCVMRSGQGFPYYSISSDSGKTWMTPKRLRYSSNGDFIAHPLAPCPIYPIDNNQYVLIFNNNTGNANGGSSPSNGLKNRTPSFLAYAKETLTETQPISFSTPIRFLENYVRPYGPQSRTEIGTYPSMTKLDNDYILWYPDRKHFLLGKKIPPFPESFR